MPKKSFKTIKTSYLQKFRRQQLQYIEVIDKLNNRKLNQITNINNWTVRQLAWHMANDLHVLSKKITDAKQDQSFQLPKVIEQLLTIWLTKLTAKQYNAKQLIAKYNLCYAALVYEINKLENKDLRNPQVMTILDSSVQQFREYKSVLIVTN